MAELAAKAVMYYSIYRQCLAQTNCMKLHDPRGEIQWGKNQLLKRSARLQRLLPSPPQTRLLLHGKYSFIHSFISAEELAAALISVAFHLYHRTRSRLRHVTSVCSSSSQKKIKILRIVRSLVAGIAAELSAVQRSVSPFCRLQRDGLVRLFVRFFVYRIRMG